MTGAGRLVASNLKTNLDYCVCGCGKFGSPKKNGHVRRCDPKLCQKCRNGGNRRRGLNKQNDARRALGVDPNRTGGGNEENWSDALFSTEVKSGHAQIGPAVNAWTRFENQIIANRPDHGGQHKASRVVLMPTGWAKEEGLVIVRLSTWRELIRPALESHWGEG